jgi:hypothetical protein
LYDFQALRRSREVGSSASVTAAICNRISGKDIIYAKIDGVWLAPAWLEGREVIAVFEDRAKSKPPDWELQHDCVGPLEFSCSIAISCARVLCSYASPEAVMYSSGNNLSRSGKSSASATAFHFMASRSET